MTVAIPLALARRYWDRRAAPYFRKEFARVGAAMPDVQVRYSAAGGPAWDVVIERRGQGFTLVLDGANKANFGRSMRYMTCPFAYWMSLCPPEVKRICVNASDGEQYSQARFAASVRFPQHIGLPDPHFFQNNGFLADQVAGQAAPGWDDRSDDVVWRGGTNGCGWISLAPEDVDNPAVVQRVRMVQRLKGLKGVDARLVDMPWALTQTRPVARRDGLLGDPLPSPSWLGRKFAIDIDGHTNTWSNLLVRMLHGCCVLKVQSQFGFTQWYYDELRPFEHYVPVAADMSDFAERIDWVRSHDREARAIAERGQALARGLSFASQAQRAAAIIEDNWDRTDA